MFRVQILLCRLDLLLVKYILEVYLYTQPLCYEYIEIIAFIFKNMMSLYSGCGGNLVKLVLLTVFLHPNVDETHIQIVINKST